jgi:thiol:disulfide interchange protein
MMNRLAFTALCFAVFLAPGVAQELPVKKGPTVTMAPQPVTTVTRGKSNLVELLFRVEAGFHINSHQPTEKYLIPTTLKLDPPTDIVVSQTSYPPGKESSFAFAPDEKLSVYTGDFAVTLRVRALTSVLPGKYEVRGKLRYQACDNAQCYPPKTLPLQFEVKVVKAKAPPAKNPPQSPHEHK